MPPELDQILISPQRGAAMQAVESVEAIAGVGLLGDRYASGLGAFSRRDPIVAGGRELSLIDEAAISTCNQRLGTALLALDMRRNLVVTGLNLAELRGQTLSVGCVKIELLSTCPPCGYLSRLLGADMRQGLKHLGGMRARILVSGVMHCGDVVAVI